MPIYFLRHGQSKANVKGLFAGQGDDSPLTELGKQQAKKAGEELKAFSISKIIASPLTRTQQTAQIVANEIGYDVNAIKTDARIAEYDMGILTGQPNKMHREITSHELISAEGAEDPIAFQHRVIDFLHDHKDSPENILVVSHAGVGRIIESARHNIDPTLFYDIEGYPNGHAVKLDLDWLSSK